MSGVKRARQPDSGIGWLFERRGSSAQFWCANCEASLSVEVDDEGYPFVANHLDTGDCDHIRRIHSMWNGMIARVVS